MGFDITYSTAELISPRLQQEIIADLDTLSLERSWIQCVGPSFENQDGYLLGSSRMMLDPHERDLDDARDGGAPDGTVLDLLEQLCRLSGMHDVEIEIAHDHSDGVVGSIVAGIADEGVKSTFEGLSAMCEGLDENPFGDED